MGNPDGLLSAISEYGFTGRLSYWLLISPQVVVNFPFESTARNPSIPSSIKVRISFSLRAVFETRISSIAPTKDRPPQQLLERRKGAPVLFSGPLALPVGSSPLAVDIDLDLFAIESGGVMVPFSILADVP